MKKFDPLQDLVDLQGKVIIVTGGNRGTGLATVRHLAKAGAKVYMAARNEAKATEAIEQLTTEGFGPGNGQVEWLKLDLSDPREAKKAAEVFMEKEKRLDVLVNNAGLLTGTYETTSDGLSTIIVVNYLSPFVFTRTLLPVLTSTANEPGSDVRVVNLSSMMHKFTPSGVKFSDIEDLNVDYHHKIFSAYLRYSHSKLLDILWTRALQKHFDTASPQPIPILAMAVHPGGVDTFSHNWFPSWFWTPLVRLSTNSPEVGSYTSVFAAGANLVREERDKYKGVYLFYRPVGTITAPSAMASDDKLADDLWALTNSVLDKLRV
ncbi:hypothetical protein D9757_003775 [Collybiopsis confluens]|uniref:NAD-P-binding protein n=1 Tax=Collybiopsis confluens TaxID=2823264 RepID=A0A8H5HV95_9AGAR|nr:hypothetical protein D9757_003775 [Collybiopsis confluens]